MVRHADAHARLETVAQGSGIQSSAWTASPVKLLLMLHKGHEGFSD